MIRKAESKAALVPPRDQEEMMLHEMTPRVAAKHEGTVGVVRPGRQSEEILYRVAEEKPAPRVGSKHHMP